MNVAALYEAITTSLFQISPDGWNPVSVSSWTYPMVPDGEGIQAYAHRGEVVDVMLYRLPGKEAFKIDLYTRIPFEKVRDVFKRTKRKKTKAKIAEELKEAVDSGLEAADKLFPGCVVFFSADLLPELNRVKGMKPHPDGPDGEIDTNIIAAAPIFLYKKHTFILVSRTMMDEDYTPRDMYVLIPMFSFVANRTADDGRPNKVYELIREIYAEAIIVNSEGWAEEAIENGMCGSAVRRDEEDDIEDWMNKREPQEDGKMAMDTTPVKIGDNFHWGEQDNGDILFTKEQMEGIDLDVKSILKMTPPGKWGIILPTKDSFSELLGLDYTIGYRSNHTVYTISMMKDYDGSRFYVFSTFIDGKKREGRLFYEKDFANYTLCKYRMNIVMQMILSEAAMADEAIKNQKPEPRKRRISSRSARIERRKKS